MNTLYTAFRIFLLMVLMHSMMHADSLAKVHTNKDIMSLVNKVKEAKVSERRRLMNELKISLRKVNQASRQRIMLQLRKNFSNPCGVHPIHLPHAHNSKCHEARNMSMNMHHDKGKKQKKQSKRGK